MKKINKILFGISSLIAATLFVLLVIFSKEELNIKFNKDTESNSTLCDSSYINITNTTNNNDASCDTVGYFTISSSVFNTITLLFLLSIFYTDFTICNEFIIGCILFLQALATFSETFSFCGICLYFGCFKYSTPLYIIVLIHVLTAYFIFSCFLLTAIATLFYKLFERIIGVIAYIYNYNSGNVVENNNVEDVVNNDIQANEIEGVQNNEINIIQVNEIEGIQNNEINDNEIEGNNNFTAHVFKFETIINIKKYDDQEACLICIEEFKKDDKIIILDCSHYFHEKCFVNWKKETKNKDMKCLLCKT